MKKQLYLFIVSILSVPFLCNGQTEKDLTENIRQKNQSWHGWSGVSCHPKKIFYPEHLTDIQAIIKQAHSTRIPIRFIGSGHSLNELVCNDNGYLVNTDHFDNILQVDKKNHTVRVEGGIKLKTLFKKLAREYGLALLNQGFIKEQSIAGALATGTHGTGKTGTLSDFIISIELIDGQGNYHIISKNSNPEWLEAARLNLGALGFVYAVTLQCAPLFVLEHKRVLTPWQKILSDFDYIYKKNDYFMIMAHPASQKALVYTWNITKKKPTNNFFIRLTEKLLSNEVTNYLTVKASHLAPGLMNEVIEPLFSAMQQDTHRAYSYKTLSPIKVPLAVDDYFEEEIAIPRVYFKQAIKDVFRLYKKYEHQDFELVGFMTCRFVNGSRKALLSPAYDQDVAYISLITINKFTKCKQFYQEFEALMARYPIARPHWGKHNNLTTSKVAQLWEKQLEQFNQVRHELDPYNLFMNDYLKERLN